jgi:hypothetical protein
VHSVHLPRRGHHWIIIVETSLSGSSDGSSSEPSASVSPSLSSQPGVSVSSSPSVSSGPSVSSVPSVSSQPSVSSCPANDCNDSGILRQHTDATILSEGINCSNGVSASSRCFHLANEGCALELIVDTVTFGVANLVVDNYTVVINLHKGGGNGCDSTATVGHIFSSGPVATSSVTLNKGSDQYPIIVHITTYGFLSLNDSLLLEIIHLDPNFLTGARLLSFLYTCPCLRDRNAVNLDIC